MEKLTLVAPVQGWVSPLDEAPDPVFAERMLGDGLLIDPVGDTLHAPCAGEILSVHEGKHAVAMRCDSGAEILMHVGIDTIALKGKGFSAHVAPGQRVSAGDLLLSFDLDVLAQGAKSLVTPVLVTNGEAYSIVRRTQDRAAKVGDLLMELRGAGAAQPASAAASVGPEARRTLIMPLAHGLHARPAARVAECAKGFASEITINSASRGASASSPVGLLSLALRGGDEITIVARGADSAAAADAVSALIASGMGEAVVAPREPEPVAISAAPIKVPTMLRGVMASPGLAIGQAVRLFAEDISAPEKGQGFEAERNALGDAVGRVRARIESAANAGPEAARGIMRAHLAFIDDPELNAAAHAHLVEGLSASAAWSKAIRGYIDALRALGNTRLAERADDLTDIERQVRRALAGDDEESVAAPRGAVLVADELLPSQLIRLDPNRLGGICTAQGGPTSHVSILATAMGLPSLVALGPRLAGVPNGTTVILDADAGELRVLPDAGALECAQMSLAQRQEARSAARASAAEECRTADGRRIEVFANLGALSDAKAAIENGAEGCGLLRTEFLFLDRNTPPTEDEQLSAYQAIADALGGRPLVVRTLDVGGDKAAPYLPIPAEENPALGLRGVRVSLWRPHLLRAQLNAILRVRPFGQCKIMAPMIADVAELRAVRAMFEECKSALGVTEQIDLGVMIETPAAAATADLIAAEADFLSVGTNDLTQYTLAMDRGNTELAPRVDALHPAVLRLIAQSAEGANKHGRWLGVCGGLAGELAAAPILIGLGVTELSAAPSLLPELKAQVRRLTVAPCQKLAQDALALDSADAVRALARSFQESLP